MTPPCVGHSEAGDRRGFDDAESGAFWPAMRLIEALVAAQRAPRMVLFENVPAITSDNLAAVQGAFNRVGYRCAARVVDAQHFIPQSRKRWFVVGAHESLGVDPEPLFESAMRALPKRSIELTDIIDFDAVPDRWEFPPNEVKRHLAMMSASQKRAIDKARATGPRTPPPSESGCVTRAERRQARSACRGPFRRRRQRAPGSRRPGGREVEGRRLEQTIHHYRQRWQDSHAGHSTARGRPADGLARHLQIARGSACPAASLRRAVRFDRQHGRPDSAFHRRKENNPSCPAGEETAY